jgi:Asp-tRNA(Asn)/Glu-tRNA(Gln) amidotransferase A subunit family amidase
MELKERTAVEVMHGLAAGDFSAAELAQALIKQAEDQANLNTLINFDGDRFLAAARQSDDDRAAGKTKGALHGLPIVVKDNIDVAGWVTTAATPALADHLADKQGPVMDALLDAGAIVMAKANMHELAFTPGIVPPTDGSPIQFGAYGNALNPYDTTRSPAGSSSGTGAALAARIAPAGLGSDTGGSVRNPSAWCGITGLRPTLKRYAQDLVAPISWTRDTIGPMARSVNDLVLLDQVITGAAAEAPLSLSGIRLGVDRDYYCTSADPEIAVMFEEETARLEDAGAEIIDVAIEGLEEMISAFGQAISMYEIVRALPDYLKASGAKIGVEQLLDGIAASGLKDTLRKLLKPETITEDAYQESLTLRKTLQARHATCFTGNKLDALILPATLIPPFPLADPGTYMYRGKEMPGLHGCHHNVQPPTLCGTPGLTMATKLSSNGLPLAIGLDGPAGGDRRLLAIGAAYEAIRPTLPGPF